MHGWNSFFSLPTRRTPRILRLRVWLTFFFLREELLAFCTYVVGTLFYGKNSSLISGWNSFFFFLREELLTYCFCMFGYNFFFLREEILAYCTCVVRNPLLFSFFLRKELLAYFVATGGNQSGTPRLLRLNGWNFSLREEVLAY